MKCVECEFRQVVYEKPKLCRECFEKGARRRSFAAWHQPDGQVFRQRVKNGQNSTDDEQPEFGFQK